MVCDWKVADPRHLALEIPMPPQDSHAASAGFLRCLYLEIKFSQTFRDSALSEGIYIRMRHGTRYSTSLLCVCTVRDGMFLEGGGSHPGTGIQPHQGSASNLSSAGCKAAPILFTDAPCPWCHNSHDERRPL